MLLAHYFATAICTCWSLMLILIAPFGGTEQTGNVLRPASFDNIITLAAPQRRCTTCGMSKEASDQDVAKQKIELEKAKLLRKLHLTEPPGVFINVKDIPSVLIQKEQEKYYMKEFARAAVQPEPDEKDSSIFIFGRSTKSRAEKPRSCYDSTGKPCFYFSVSFNSSSVGSKISKVLLWLYTPLAVGLRGPFKNRTLMVEDVVGEETGGKKKFVASVRLESDEKYANIDITAYALRWVVDQPFDKTIICTFRVKCEDCDNVGLLKPIAVPSNHKSFLEFRRGRSVQRRRRNVCSPELYDHCCLKEFYVNFTVIGWNNWIIQPPGYYANYCTGSCRVISSTSYNSIMRNVGNTLDLKGQSYDREIIPCCAPTKMSSLSLLYAFEPGRIHKKTVSNMIVESCGC